MRTLSPLPIRAALLCGVVLLCGCGRGANDPETGSGAALSSAGGLQGIDDSPVPRPSANLGVFVARYIEEHGTFPTTGALAGVDAQIRIVTPNDPIAEEDTFQLLQEFGNILGIDVNDLLNRSTDRAGVLNEYVSALTNIRARSALKAVDLTASLDSLKKDQQERRKRIAEIQKRINQAVKDKDFAVAGTLQQDIVKMQSELATVDGAVTQTNTALKSYKDFLTVADRRLQAIAENREILIAGLKVVDVPGIDDLELIQKGTTKRQGGTNIFGL